MKKFSLISESNRPDIEELESYFDFIKDFDFNVEIKDCYLRRPTQTPRQSAKVILDPKAIPSNEIELWSKSIVVSISKDLSGFGISFGVDLRMGGIVSPEFFDLSIDDLSQFFYELMNVISHLRNYNPILGAISTGRWFIVFDYGKLSDEEVSEGEEFKKVRNFIMDSINNWISSNRFRRDPNSRDGSGTGLKSLIGVRAEIGGRDLDHIEIVDSRGHGAQKIRVMIDILTGNLSPNQRNIQDISNIKDQVEKMGWEISESNYHGLKLRKK